MDGKSIRNKLIGDEQERAVSPVIGVILMVAITVILAAVIAAFVLDLGQGQNATAQAGVSFDTDSAANETTVTINSVSRADDLYVQCNGNIQDTTISGSTSTEGSDWQSAGDTATMNVTPGSDCGDNTIQVIGVVEGSTNVVADYDDHL